MNSTRERIMDIRDELLQLADDLDEIDQPTVKRLMYAYEELGRAL